MKRFKNNFLTIISIFTLTLLCISMAYSAGNSQKAQDILKKATKKYGNFFKKDSKELQNFAAELSIKGGGMVPMGGSGMPLDIDAKVELYVAQPKNMYLNISGSLGNATIVVTGEEKQTATILLPSTKQYAVMDVPENPITQIDEEDPEQEPFDIEKLPEDVILEYEGMHNTKLGKAHKIIVKSKDNTNEGSVAVYILDKKWDPARFEINDPEKGTLSIEVNKWKVNEKISKDTFELKTSGYTLVPEKQILGVIMMQVMNAMMQQTPVE